MGVHHGTWCLRRAHLARTNISKDMEIFETVSIRLKTQMYVTFRTPNMRLVFTVFVLASGTVAIFYPLPVVIDLIVS